MMNYITSENSHEYIRQLPKRKQTKQEKIIDIINSNPNGKYIVFSSFDETLTIIRNTLKDDDIEFTEISGTMSSRSKKIDNFKYGGTNVLFMNSMSNGAGINLQEATDLILYHRMPEDLETQIIGRAHRIGRRLSLNVHHLV
jgi:SNF2 family DNA or RNA helicase